MKLILVVLCLVGICIAAPPRRPTAFVPIISQENVVEPDGTFHWSYESGDGTKARESGALKNFGDTEADVVEGAFSYKSPDGQEHGVQYTADENGYHPQGPDVHPTPAAILKAIEWIRAHPPQ